MLRELVVPKLDYFLEYSRGILIREHLVEGLNEHLAELFSEL